MDGKWKRLIKYGEILYQNQTVNMDLLLGISKVNYSLVVEEVKTRLPNQLINFNK